jgi:hypothetical protein
MLREVQIIVESWRRHYNAIRLHASLSNKLPALKVSVPTFSAWWAVHIGVPATLASAPAPNQHWNWTTQ